MANIENHQILSSNDLHEMQDLLATLTKTHQVDVIGKGQEVDASLRYAAFSDMGLFHVTYGRVPTHVHAHEEDEDALLLFILTEGGATVKHNGQEFEVSTDVGMMRNMKMTTEARQDAFASFAIPFSNSALKEHARALIGDDACLMQDVEFEGKVDLSTAGGRHLRNTVSYISDALDGPLRNLDNPMVLDGFKDLLLTSVLTLLPNSYSERLQGKPKSTVVPHYVKRARDFIQAHAGVSITLENLVHHSGCSYRTLQIAFNEAYGMPPMAYVKVVRLNFARNDLRFAEDGVSVADVALKWGFSNVGRFAQSYNKQFGVMPSQTLRTRI